MTTKLVSCARFDADQAKLTKVTMMGADKPYSRLYADYNATSPLRADAIAAMTSLMSTCFGNPSSVHQEGRLASRRLELARREILAAIDGESGRLVFTSSATEANNTVIATAATRSEALPPTVVTSAVEHPSIREPCRHLASCGFIDWRAVSVDSSGQLREDPLLPLLSRRPRLVSLVLANSETGVILNIPRYLGAIHESGALLHLDATQLIGRRPFSADKSGADFITFSSHKLGGPRGIAALWCRRPHKPAPLIRGGNQEYRLRAGTEDVVSATGFAAAVTAAVRMVDEYTQKTLSAKTALRAGLAAMFDDASFHGYSDDPNAALPNTLNFAIPGISSEAMVLGLDARRIAISSGTACSSGSFEPSAALIEMGVARDIAACAVRVSLGPDVTSFHVICTLDAIKDIVSVARAE